MRLRSPDSDAAPYEGRLAPDFDLAVSRLLDRWVAMFPRARKPSVTGGSS